MSRSNSSLRQLTVALAMVLLAAACSSGSDNSGSVTGATPDGPDSPRGEPGDLGGAEILVTSTEITGHEGELLVIHGPGSESEVCASITSDAWTLPPTPLTDRPADGPPCAGDGEAATIFDPGDHVITARIYVPGSQTPVGSTAAVATVADGHGEVVLSGDELSGDSRAAAGRIIVTASEITGQQGRLLIVLAQDNRGSLCASIDSEVWSLDTPTPLTDLSSEGGPCGDGTSPTAFPAGSTLVTVAIVIPGRPTAEASIELVVQVDGDTSVEIDGSLLAA